MDAATLSAAASHAASSLGYELYEKQELVLRSFLSGRDVFGVLPTGYGKSLCYACLPAAFDHLYKDKGPHSTAIVVVVTPLVAIMKDQASIIIV